MVDSPNAACYCWCYNIVYWYLKTFIIMAKIILKFIACDDENVTIQTFCNSTKDNIVINMSFIDGTHTICLDKSTAIKFAKTLRTEINKMEDDTNE